MTSLASPHDTLKTRTGTMNAAVIAAPRRAVIKPVPLPNPGPGQVRIRIDGCGVCGSNIPAWEGREWFKYPLRPGAPGHEPWGTIDALGEGVEGLAPGQRVAALSDSAFAEFDIAEASQVVPLPSQLDGQPFPGEALGCAMNIFSRCQVQTGQTVCIVGIGFLGAVLTQLAVESGAQVIAVSRRSFSLDIATRMGATETVLLDDAGSAEQRVGELTQSRLCDTVIEAVGQQMPLTLAGRLVRERGRLVIAGYHQDGPRQVDMQLWNWRGLDVINAHERDPAVYVDGMRRAVEAVSSGRLDPSPLYSHTFSLSRLGEALEMAQARPNGFLKALITPEH